MSDVPDSALVGTELAGAELAGDARPSALRRLLVFERQLPGGAAERTWLLAEPLALQLDEQAPRVLPAGCLGSVFARFGQPFEVQELERSSRELEWTGELRLPHGNIRSFRHRTWFDVVARDYLVYSDQAAEHPQPRFDLCTSVAAALDHLATAYARACISR